MAFYKTPIRPIDPVVQDVPPPSQRYLRDNFSDTGQDSHTEPPAQDQSLWQALTNIMPITTGTLQRRWGYNQFATGLNSGTNRLYSYQRDSDGLRVIIATGGTNIQALTEAGAMYNSAIYTPARQPMRVITSRSYAYLFNGYAPDLVKWNGDASSGVSNTGINVNAVTTGATFGPNLPNTALDLADHAHAWSSVNNVKADDGIVAGITLPTGTGSTNTLQAKNYGLTTTGLSVVGIQVDIKLQVTGSVADYPINLQLVKDNGTGTSVAYGAQRQLFPDINAALKNYTVGGPADLWSGIWIPSDTTTTTFGVNITAPQKVSSSITIQIDYIKITVYVVPGAGIVVGASSAGTVNLTVGRIYYLAFKNSITGHYSNISTASVSTGPATNKEFPLSWPANTDPQVDTNVILATADGGDPSILYLVAELPVATLTYTDNTPELNLVNQQVLVFTDTFGNETGIVDNDPPPVPGSLAVKHQGRIWMAQGQNLFFSKAVADLTMPNGFIAGKYEECWPASNYFDISEGAETVSGLLSDGVNLYIGTQNHIRVLTGNDPTNFTQPEIVHPNVGVLNQEAWQLVFLEGTPAGCVFLTPDFRVIGSDFNTYMDIGTPIQDVLNSIQPSAASLVHAALVSDGEFELYILAVPINSTTACDTHLVYDMRRKRWFVWQPHDTSLALLFNVSASGAPQWLFTDGLSLFQYTAASTTDNGTAIPETADTSWLHLGEPSARKVLDDIEVIGDSNMLVTVFGASSLADFDSPVTILADRPLVTSPFGQFKVYLATAKCRNRYYKFRFKSSSGATEFLNSYSIRNAAFHTL